MAEPALDQEYDVLQVPLPVTTAQRLTDQPFAVAGAVETAGAEKGVTGIEVGVDDAHTPFRRRWGRDCRQAVP